MYQFLCWFNLLKIERLDQDRCWWAGMDNAHYPTRGLYRKMLRHGLHAVQVFLQWGAGAYSVCSVVWQYRSYGDLKASAALARSPPCRISAMSELICQTTLKINKIDPPGT